MISFEFTIKEPPVPSQTNNRPRLQQGKANVRQAAAARVAAAAVLVGVAVPISTTYCYEGDTPDVHNNIKPMQDALNRLLIVDDAQCQQTKSRKRPLNGSHQITGLSGVHLHAFLSGLGYLQRSPGSGLGYVQQQLRDVWSKRLHTDVLQQLELREGGSGLFGETFP